MRITRLLLARYGHLSDVALSFPADRGLHVVLGANEAGKSTALSAIRDALFGFAHRTEYAFLHDTGELRVGIAVLGEDGRAAGFVRRKGKKNDLLDEAGAPVPESALAGFLGGVTRDRFAHWFGLDAVELRRGGAAILNGEGDVGESILQAHTGISGFRQLAKKLNDKAGELYGDRRGSRAFHAAADQYAVAKKTLADRTLNATDYVNADAERRDLEQLRETNGQAAGRLAADRTRLNRIRATAPARAALAEAETKRADLGTVPALPADAETRRQAAILARDTAADALRRERERAAAAREKLAALVIDEAVLDAGPAIDALIADRNRIAAALTDRDKRRIIADQHARQVEEAGQRLGLPGDAAALIARIPDALSRDAASRAIAAHIRLSERSSKAGDALADAMREDAAAQAALAAATAPAPHAELRAAIDAVKAEGRIDAERDTAAHAARAAEREAAEALTTLPLGPHYVETLAAAVLPLEASVAHAAKALDTHAATLATRATKLAAQETALAEIAAELHALTDAGDLPTAEAIADARARRDHEWHRLRRVLLSGEVVAGAPALADRFETLLRDADALSDRQATDAARVETFRQLTAQQVKHGDLRSRAADELASAAAEHESALLAWRALWQPCGIVADDPAAMREWRKLRDDVLAKRRAAVAAAQALAAIEARYAAGWTLLAALLPPETVAQAGNLAGLLRAAERVLAQHMKTAEEHAALTVRVKTAVTARAKAEAEKTRIDADLTQWRAEWQAAVQRLGLPTTTEPEAGKPALDLWTALDGHARDWREATDRIAEMTADIDAFAATTTALAHRIAPDLAAAEPQDAVRQLAARLATARAAATDKRTLETELAKLQTAIRDAEDVADKADATFASLRAQAGAADDAALAAATARATTHAALSQVVAARTAELHQLGDGKPLAALAQEAENIDPDTLPGRLAEIDTRLRGIHDDNLTITTRLTELRAILNAMEAGHDAAGAAQTMQHAVAEMETTAARYIRLRLAHTLLRAGIERFRRQQQDPLLGRAGLLFARLTEGRYDRLDVEEADDERRSISALRPDGTSCPVERLSEGTRDQLFLALRLAAIEGAGGAMPFIADDLLVNFDDRRARAALRVLGEFGARTQTILFTHHAHIAALADPRHAAVQGFAGAAFMPAD